jgi:hypothetical protein
MAANMALAVDAAVSDSCDSDGANESRDDGDDDDDDDDDGNDNKDDDDDDDEDGGCGSDDADVVNADVESNWFDIPLCSFSSRRCDKTHRSPRKGSQ